MVYVKQEWKNLPSKTTPLSAGRLKHLETQYDEAIAFFESEVREQVEAIIDDELINKINPAVDQAESAAAGSSESAFQSALSATAAAASATASQASASNAAAQAAVATAASQSADASRDASAASALESASYAQNASDIADQSVTGGAVVVDNLVLTRKNGETIDAGNVRGATGPFTQITAGTATPLLPTDNPTVALSGPDGNKVLDFGIPRGIQGEPSTVPGPKGDKGGWDIPTNINTLHLDTFLTTGLYRQASGTNATLAQGYPVAGLGGILSVFDRNGTSIMQEYAPADVNGFYRRWKSGGGAWLAWKFFASERIDQTAGRAIYTWDSLNNREQLTYGDTGVRDLSSLVDTSIVDMTKAPLFRLRRVGMHVTVELSYTPLVTAASPIVPIAAGFQGAAVPFPGVQETAPWRPVVHYFSGGSLYASNHAAGSKVTSLVTYTTTQAWPSILPGTASGTIPNL